MNGMHTKPDYPAHGQRFHEHNFKRQHCVHLELRHGTVTEIRHVPVKHLLHSKYINYTEEKL